MRSFPANRATLLLVVAVLVIVGCGSSESNEPLHFTIGLLTNNPNGLRNVQGFRDGMTKLGYREGENVSYLFAGGPVDNEALDSALQDFLDSGVDLIFTAGTPTGVAAHRVTAGTGTPVVFGVIADPIAAGVMTDLTHPGGNMTGVMLSRSQDRRLQLLLELIPGLERIFVPYSPNDSAAATAVAQIETLAPLLGVTLVLGPVNAEENVSELLESVPADIEAIFLVPDSVVNAALPEIVDFATRNRLPVSGPSTAQIEEGALTTYGFIHHAAGEQAARMAALILKGSDPGDLPVQTTEFYLGINLAAAASIGIEIPDEFVHRAQIVIRPEAEN